MLPIKTHDKTMHGSGPSEILESNKNQMIDLKINENEYLKNKMSKEF